MERLLGIDLGDVRTGLAVSDPLGVIASGIGTLSGLNEYELIREIKKKISEYQITRIVIGNPVNMNGTVGERSLKVKAFAEKLEAETGVRVVMFDERCTTMVAHSIMNLTDTRGKKRKQAVDTLSAQIILQNYMGTNRP